MARKPIQTANPEHGFHGVMRSHFGFWGDVRGDASPERKAEAMDCAAMIYEVAANWLIENYKVGPVRAVSFLDSKDGRHFGDRVVEGFPGSIVGALNDARGLVQLPIRALPQPA